MVDLLTLNLINKYFLQKKRKSKTTSSTPQVVIISVYTTTVSVTDNLQNKHYSERVVKDHDPKNEMKILSNLIYELIINNDTVIDDLTNARILSNDDNEGMSKFKDKKFLDHNKYRHSKGHNFIVDKKTRVTRPIIRIELESTPTATFIEGNEFTGPEYSNKDVSSEKSSYSFYELDIPIKDTVFVKESYPRYKPTSDSTERIEAKYEKQKSFKMHTFTNEIPNKKTFNEKVFF